MIDTLLRMLWRLIILILGIFILWLLVFKVYPFADTRAPAYIVGLGLYCVAAYVVIPFLMRLFRLGEQPNHIPLYAITGDGWPSDPINVAIVADDIDHLKTIFKEAGWYEADPMTVSTWLKGASSILFNSPYPTAPFSKLYLFGRPYDIGFQKPSNHRGSARSRHHVRFWRLEMPDHPRHLRHFHFWTHKLRHILGLSKEVWVGAAVEDVRPFAIQWRNSRLIHKISHDTDAERDFLITALYQAGHVKAVTTVQAGQPFSFRGRTNPREKIVCDGSIRVVTIKTSLLNNLIPN